MRAGSSCGLRGEVGEDTRLYVTRYLRGGAFYSPTSSICMSVLCSPSSRRAPLSP